MGTDYVAGLAKGGAAMIDGTHRQRVAREFGAALRAARQLRGFTQEQLANRAHLDRTYASLLERGLRAPTVAMLLRLAEALEMGPAELVIITVERMRREFE
jgi:transcriptional regulator with XRE-family HTH domain